MSPPPKREKGDRAGGEVAERLSRPPPWGGGREGGPARPTVGVGAVEALVMDAVRAELRRYVEQLCTQLEGDAERLRRRAQAAHYSLELREYAAGAATYAEDLVRELRKGLAS